MPVLHIVLVTLQTVASVDVTHATAYYVLTGEGACNGVYRSQ